VQLAILRGTPAHEVVALPAAVNRHVAENLPSSALWPEEAELVRDDGAGDAAG
jgi:hypothetical protein